MAPAGLSIGILFNVGSSIITLAYLSTLMIQQLPRLNRKNNSSNVSFFKRSLENQQVLRRKAL